MNSSRIATLHATSAPQSFPEKPPNILLIEDNIMTTHVVKTLFTQAGSKITAVSNAEDAIPLAQASRFDLILTDIILPGMLGFRFTQIMREWETTHKKMPTRIIGLSALKRESTMEAAHKVGMNDLYITPVTKSMVQKLLQQIDKQTESLLNVEQNMIQNTSPLGFELPNAEEELFQLQQYPLFDHDSLAKNLGGEEHIKTILDIMVNQGLPKDLSDITAAYNAKNWDMVEGIAHRTKGGAASTGAVRLKFACQYLERYQKAGHSRLREKLYQQLLNVIADTEKHIKQELAK